MNIFHIASWYPSPQHPITGIFIKEQIEILAREFPEHNFGISSWGQNDERLLLWTKDHFRNIRKIIGASALEQNQEKYSKNLVYYFSPAFTWTWNFMNGNIKSVLKHNLFNYQRFQSEFGKVDIIHAHVAFPAGFIAMNLSKKLSLPYIITEQMSPFPFKYFVNHGKLSRRIEAPYKYSACNIAVSEGLKDKMKANGIEVGKVIYNYVDSEYFTTIEKRSTGEFVFFSLGRLVPQKGMDILLKAFKNVLSETPDVLLKIGGDGSGWEEYQELSKSLELKDKIEWLGELTRPAVKEHMQSCDAFVLASRHESMGIVFAEALACGKPVIGTRCGGPENIIKENNGYLVQRENVAELTKAMIKMIQSHERFNPKKIRQDFDVRFSDKVICPQIIEVYEEILRRSNTIQKS